MAVLIDEARWLWRGRHWAHLVSDDSYDELHAFARSLGLRRLGFQGDHYDIDSVDRGRAIERGALAIPSRALVGRLKSAGLRDRNNKPGWRRSGEWLPGVGVDDLPGSLAADATACALDLFAAHVAFFEDDVLFALVVDLPSSMPIPDAADQVATGRRVDGSWSAEFFVAKSSFRTTEAR